MLATEARNFWLAYSELRATGAAGEWSTARLALEELEAIGMHTSSVSLRCRTALAIREVASSGAPASLRRAAAAMLCRVPAW